MQLARFATIFFIIATFFSFVLLSSTSAQGTGALKNQITQRLAEIQAQISGYQREIAVLSQKNRTLEEEIALLDAEIAKIELQIEASEATLQGLQAESARLRSEIDILTLKLNEYKAALSANLRGVYQLDQRSLLESFLSDAGFSRFFDQIQYFQGLQENIALALATMLEQKDILDQKQEELDGDLAEQGRLIALQEFSRSELEASQARKASLVKENIFASFAVAEKSKELEEVAAQLRQRLFILEGLPASLALSEAYEKARYISARVDINPLFLMAILKVESDFGNNVGGGNWRSDMHPRDRDAFLQITQKLGLNPDIMPVSAKPRYGWGGAMGPAQFLPTTWLAYEKDVASITGHNPPNPWDIDDAFAAAAVKLSRNGAHVGTYEAEWGAAMKYFAGGNWKNPAYSFYGDRVMQIKAIIAEQI